MLAAPIDSDAVTAPAFEMTVMVAADVMSPAVAAIWPAFARRDRSPVEPPLPIDLP